MPEFNHELSLANHRITRWTFADATARLAKTGLTSNDVDKVAKEVSTGTYWVVLSVSAGVPTWTRLSPFSGTEFVSNKTNDVLGNFDNSVKYPSTKGVFDFVVASLTGFVTNSSIGSFTNKRIIPRVQSISSSATPTINTDNVDIYKITAQAIDITSFTTNLSGTPSDSELLEIIITGTAARAITWGSSFMSSTINLPTTTVSTNTLRVTLQWDTNYSKWVCVGVV